MNTTLLIFCIGAIIFLWAVFASTPWKKLSFKERFGTPMERGTLAALLNDIEKNTDEWVMLNVDLQTLTGPKIFNDKKGILVLIKENLYEVSIQIGTKIDFNSIVTTDGVITYMRGPFVTKFIKKAQKILNTREKELGFFKGVLDKKLQG